MKLLRNHPILFVPLGLLAAFLIFPFLGSENWGQERSTSTAGSESEKLGFADYDLLPEALKQKMTALVNQHPKHHYIFTYYFDNDDLHHRYYITDLETEVIAPQPVTDQDALALVEQRISEPVTRSSQQGMNYIWHPDFFDTEKRDSLQNIGKGKLAIQYVIPKDSADYHRLRIAIVEQTYMRPEETKEQVTQMADTQIYFAEALETVPEPIRGMDYFRETVAQEALQSEVFKFYDLQGEVTVEFLVWGTQAQSPNLVRGFSTKEETYEAYRADGAFIKAINNAKVRWKPGTLNGKPVKTKMRMTFTVNSQTLDIRDSLTAML